MIIIFRDFFVTYKKCPMSIHLHAFVECESSLESNSPEILALCETNFDDSTHSGNFSVQFPFNLKRFYYSYTWSCIVREGRTSFCSGLISRKLCEFLCFWLALFHSVSCFIFPYRSPSSLCTVFDAISSNIDEIPLINPSANVFVFGEFNIHHKN